MNKTYLYKSKRLIVAAMFVLSPLVVSGQAETPESWYQSGQAELQQALAQQANTGQAKNIILFVGDGMGVTTVTAARIFDGQDRDQNGEENLLAFERLPYLGLSKTYNTNQQTADSAGTMTAMMSGIKTKAGFIGLDQIPARGDCENALQHAVPTFLEQAETAGLATGIVSTARLTHATPAATFAHVPERDWEGDSEIPDNAKAQGCRDIAQQLIEFDKGDGLEVALGGGRRFFIPEDQNGGRRQDGRDLTAEWTQKYSNSAYVANRQDLAAINAKNTQH
jgi:alkaline phosphatase